MPGTVRTHPTQSHRHAGVVGDDPRAAQAARDGDEILEWMEGGYFLVHRWDASAGRHVVQGTRSIGDAPEGGWFTRFFGHAGSRPGCRLAVDGDTWTFEEPGSRATVAIADEGACLEIAWPWHKDGVDWLPVCELVSPGALRDA